MPRPESLCKGRDTDRNMAFWKKEQGSQVGLGIWKKLSGIFEGMLHQSEEGGTKGPHCPDH